MRRRKLECIREFVREVDAATRPGRPRHVQETRLVRAYHRLPAGVQKLVAAGYRQCLMANGDAQRAQAARQVVVTDLIRGTGLTREQILTMPAGPQPTDVAVPKRRRADSQPDSQPVATAVPVSRFASRWPPLRARRWLPYALAAITSMTCAGIFLARSWYPTSMQRPTPPQPTARETFPIDRMVEFHDGLLLFSHGVIDGETTWLNAYEVNLGDDPKPAVEPIVEVDARDIDGQSERAERILDISESGKQIPAKSVRHRVIPVKTRPDRSWFLETTRGSKASQRQQHKVESLLYHPLD